MLANMQLTAVSEDRIMAGTVSLHVSLTYTKRLLISSSFCSTQTVLKDAQERLTKAEEEVKEDIERERLLKEIELLDSLLDPKVIEA